jgi:general L-amino acid transport system substrate-binding protein
MDAAIMDRHCQVTTALLSKLAEARETFHDAQDYVFLPDIMALVPASAAVDAHETKLSAIVDYTLTALLQAEVLGVTRANVMSLSHSDDPRVARLLGDDYASAVGLGLPHDWSRRVIAAVGNYAEIYGRSIGPGTSYDLARGINALWNKGGAMAPLPLR